MDDIKEVSSFVCAEAFNVLVSGLIGRGVMAGVKKTPASIIPRLVILAVVNEGIVLAKREYAEWCLEVGDVFTSSVRKGYLWSKRKCLGKMLEDVYEDIRNK